ncbi:MAG: RNA polymerase sigma factor, partial [Planctomycetota bacterium JB042]
MTAEEFQKLLEHAGWLRALAVSLATEPSEAEDAVQETFLAALRDPPDASRSVRPWLREVLKNVLRQRKRTERRRASRELATASPSSGELGAAAEVAAQSELFRGLAREVHMLDEPYRTAIVLRYLEEKSTPEIARQLDVPESTVRSRIERGRKRLRERLDGRYPDRRAWVALVLPADGSGGPAAPAAAASSGAGSIAGVVLGATAAAVVLTAITLFRPGDPGPGGEAAAVVLAPVEGGRAPRPSAEVVRAPEREREVDDSGTPETFVVPVPIDGAGWSTDGLTAEAVHREGGRTWVGSGRS